MDFLLFFIFMLFLIIFYLVLYFFLPIIIVDKIFHLKLNIKLKFITFLYLLFLPFSALFSYFYYKKLFTEKIVKNVWNFCKIIFSLIFFCIFIVATFNILKREFFQPFQLSWNSMFPNYYDREYFLVNKKDDYERLDVIVFNLPNKSHFFIKRVVWLPWESIKFENWNFYVWDKNWENFKIVDFDYEVWEFTDLENVWKVFFVPENSYFVAWDNIILSIDSLNCFWFCDRNDRNIFVKTEEIRWKVFFDLWYFNLQNWFEKDWVSTFPKFLNIK